MKHKISSFHSCPFCNQWKKTTGLVIHYNTYLLPFIALNNESLGGAGLFMVSECVLWPLGGRARCWTNQTYLFSMKLVHTQLEACSLFFVLWFFFFSLSLYNKKTLPEHYYLGPLDLFSLTPMKPEGQLCSGVYKMLFFCFLYFVCKPNVNYVLYWVCQPHSL